MEFIPVVLSQLLVAAPTILVQIVGLIIALARWQQHPRVSLLVTIALVIMLALHLASTVTVILPITMSQSGSSVTQIGMLMSAIGILANLAGALSWGLMLVALFSRRESVQIA